MKLEGKTAIITGAGRGLGRSVALAYANEGANVSMFSRTHDELKSVSDEISGECLIIQGDVSKEDDVIRLVEQTISRYGKIDILFNNAAVIGPPRFLEDADTDHWMKIININLTGMYYCCHHVIPKMIENGGGKIINITSGIVGMHFPHFCAYAVSKAGVDQLTRSLSEEFKSHNIQINAFNPGLMDTAMQDEMRGLGDKLHPDVHQLYESFKSDGQLRRPSDIAKMCVFLASAESNHITGRILSSDDLKKI